MVKKIKKRAPVTPIKPPVVKHGPSSEDMRIALVVFLLSAAMLVAVLFAVAKYEDSQQAQAPQPVLRAALPKAEGPKLPAELEVERQQKVFASAPVQNDGLKSAPGFRRCQREVRLICENSERRFWDMNGCGTRGFHCDDNCRCKEVKSKWKK